MNRNMQAFITNGWADTALFCMNCGESQQRLELELIHNTLYYKCPICGNCITTNEFEKMLSHLHQQLVDATLEDTVLDLTNYTWKERSGIGKGNVYKVLEQNGSNLSISVLSPISLTK